MSDENSCEVCPLCKNADTVRFHEDEDRTYLRCPACMLTFVPQTFHLSHAEEYAHYGTHDNDPADQRYRAFLDRLASQLIPKLRPGSSGLDYGSGPGPTLSVMLAEQGFSMRIYDPYFAPETDVLNTPYDFITCSETCEHFADPAQEFVRFHTLLRPGGWLGVMTQMLEPNTPFGTWWYRRDPTHICFYHAETMRWIADHYGWHLEMPAPNIALFQKVTL